MGMSTHEMYLLLRARDEATRVLRGFSNGVSGLRGKVAIANESLDKHNRQLGNIESALRRNHGAYVTNGSKIKDMEGKLVSLDDKQRTSLQTYSTMRRRVDESTSAYERRKDAIKKSIDANDLERDSLYKHINALDTSNQKLEANAGKLRTHRDTVMRHRDAVLKQVAAADLAIQKAEKAQAMGIAMGTIGIGIALFGAAIASGLKNASDAYIEYRQSASKTLTQVDRDLQAHGFGLNDVMKIGNNVASELPVKFDQVQQSLYDVFSTIETDGPGAEKILMGIGKAAVAGGTDMETAGRSVMGILNAWKLDATDIDKVNDVMFTTVQKGTGTYDQFALAFGKATPSAKKAGQSYQQLGAMLAFMTKNGMTSAQAGTSAARAFDMLSNPKFENNIKKYGLSAYDATGKMRPMTDVVSDLRSKMQGMTDIQKNNFIASLGKGAGGTIQAMKFLNLGLEDAEGNVVQLKDGTDKSVTMLQWLTDEMYNAGGATDNAYDIMKDTPEARWQAMMNKFEVFQNNVGKAIQPIRDFFTNTVGAVLDWFNKLDPGMQQTIVTIVAVVAVISILSGIILIVAGGFMALSAMAAMATVGVGAILGPIILIIAAVAAVVVIGYLLVNNWELIKTTAANLWSGFVTGITDAWNNFMTFINNIPTMWNNLVATVLAAIVNFGIQAGQFFTDIWNAIVSGVSSFFSAVVTFIVDGITAWLAPFQPFFDIFNIVIPAVFDTIKTFFAAVFLTIVGIFTGNTQLISDAWNAAVNKIQGLWSWVWGSVQTILTGAWNKIVSTLSSAWNTFTRIVSDGINAVVKFFSELPGKTIAAVTSLGAKIQSEATRWFNLATSAVSTGVSNVMKFFSELPGKVVSAVGNTGSLLQNAGRQLLEGMINGIKSMADNVANMARNAVEGAINAAKNALGIRSPSRVFHWIGKMTYTGLTDALDSGRKYVKRAGTKLANAAIVQPENMLQKLDVQSSQINPGESRTTSRGNGKTFNIKQTINTQEINPRKHAADLGYEFASRIGE